MAEASETATAGTAPSLALFLLEGQRALLERLALPAARPLLRRAPRGDGHPVLVLPGFTADDWSTRVLRSYLRDQGFEPHRWRLGRNLGPTEKTRRALGERVSSLHRQSGRKLSIVGWSLGGIYARELAKRAPDAVRQVVTLGSPFADAARPSSVSRLTDWFSGREGQRRTVDRLGAAAQLRTPPSVPTTAIYSKTDGIVHWQACLEPERAQSENIEIPGSHCGLGFNALALYAIADRLSQPEGAWTRFDRSGWRRAFYA